MKPCYFKQDLPDADDFGNAMARGQGYVPNTCLLGGGILMGVVNEGKDPFTGCEGPREKCKGRTK